MRLINGGPQRTGESPGSQHLGQGRQGRCLGGGGRSDIGPGARQRRGGEGSRQTCRYRLLENRLCWLNEAEN